MSHLTPNEQNWIDNGIDVRRRTIYLGACPDGDRAESGIDWQMSDRVITGLHLMRGEKPVHIYINSHGGEDDHARAIIAAIRMHPAHVVATVLGRAESAAAWIMQCCDYRIMAPHSSLMLHLGESAKNKHARYVDNLFIEDIYRRILERQPEYLRSKLVSHLHDDWHVYPTQALELGLCDEVIE